jgi:modification target Cys-rich repeat protein
MRKKAIGLVSLAAPALIGALAASCDKAGNNPLADGAEKLCGPCGEVGLGDVGISGNAKLDGFFEAVGKIGDTTASINGDFDANIDALGTAFAGADFDTDAAINAKVDAVVSAIKADFKANLDGGIALTYKPAECHASLDVAVKAQANCEAKAGCTGDVKPPSATVECKGSCSGSCSGKCEGAPPKCELSASAKCDTKCEGTCNLEAGGECKGTCNGTCDGTCSVKNADGSCAGECTGTCKGNCELTVAAECSGTCSGSCEVKADAMCDGGKAPTCTGSCEGKCEGSCTGEVTPPEAHVNCDASAECKGQASAKANASIECTPPSIDLKYNFKAGLSGSAQADFMARLGELKVRGGAILQGFAKYQLLINGKADASGKVLVKSPVAELTSSVQGLAASAGDIAAEVPVFRLGCATMAFEEAGQILVKVGSEGAANLAAQGKFATAFTGGFGS